jgi:hypothetical protein
LARDPMHWFCGTVSYLSCLLFDAADEALPMLASYRIGTQPGEVIATTTLPFFERLRDLRTTMQHTLKEKDRRERAILDRVEAWYYECLQTPWPEKHHWRRLTERLLEEWEQFVTILLDCLRCIWYSLERPSIERQMAMLNRRLPRHQWYSIAINAIKECHLEDRITPDYVIDTYMDQIQKKLKESPVPDQGILMEANRIVTATVVEVVARCPLEAADFLEHGIQGPLLGLCCKKAKELWEKNPRSSEDQLLKEVLTVLKVGVPK